MKKLLVIIICFTCNVSLAQNVQDNFWTTNGEVKAIKFIENEVILGGDFSYVGPYTPHLAAYDLQGEATVIGFPNVSPHSSQIHAITSDGKGGWFIGGTFEEVGGKKRKNLAHIKSDYSISDWAPTPNGVVYTIEVDDQNVYVGGEFTNISGTERKIFAAFSNTTFALNEEFSYPFTYSSTNVRVIKDYDSLLVIGGNFYYDEEKVPGKITNYAHLLVINKKTGEHVDQVFHPYNPVYDVAFTGGYLFCGGEIGAAYFRTVALMGFDIHTGAMQGQLTGKFSDVTYQHIYSLEYDKKNDVLLVGGKFSYMNYNGKVSSGENLVAIDLNSNHLIDWAPSPNEKVNELKINGEHLFVTGNFTNISGQDKQVATYAISDLSLSSLNVLLENGSNGYHYNFFYETYTLNVEENILILGGQFTSVGGVKRSNLASLDRYTGEATNWNPEATNAIQDIALYGDTVIICSGDHNATALESTKLLAAFERSSNSPLDWRPSVYGNGIYSLAIKDSLLFIGGNFSKIDGVSKSQLASFNLKGGSLTSFKTNLSGYKYVSEVAVAEKLVLARGRFDGPMRSFDIITGASVSDYSPNYGGRIERIEATDTMFFASGYFSSISHYQYGIGNKGSKSKNNLVSINAKTGEVTDWRPITNVEVLSSTTDNVATYFTTFQSYDDSIALSYFPRNSVLESEEKWFKINHYLESVLSVNDSVVYLGGMFTLFNDEIRWGIVAIPFKELIAPNPQKAELPLGETSVCSGNIESYSIPSGEEALSYVWTVTPEHAGHILTEASSSEAQILWSEDFFGQASLLVVRQNEYGQSEPSPPLTIDVSQNPDAKLTFENGILSASENAIYQWFFNDELTVENTQIFTPKESGNYYVVISNGNGCTDTSPSVYVEVMLDSNEKPIIASVDSKTEEAVMYPNPTSKRLYLKNMDTDIIQILIYDFNGIFVSSPKITKDFIDLEGFNNGAYIIKIIGKESSAVQKIFKY